MLNTIKRLCKERGIKSMNELEALSGLSVNSVYRWDENKPSVDKVAKVAAVLDVTIDELYKEEAS